MALSFAAYFAGIGTVVAAMGVGFGGALVLINTSEVKQDSTFAAKVEQSKTEEPKPEPQKQEPAPTEAAAASTAAPVGAGAQWVAVPPAQTTSAPVVPMTAPLSPPAATETPPAATARSSPAEKPSTGSPPISKKNVDERREKAAEPNAKKSVTAKVKPKDAEQEVEAEADAGPIETAAAPERLPEPPPSIKSIGAVTGNAH